MATPVTVYLPGKGAYRIAQRPNIPFLSIPITHSKSAVYGKDVFILFMGAVHPTQATHLHACLDTKRSKGIAITDTLVLNSRL